MPVIIYFSVICLLFVYALQVVFLPNCNMRYYQTRYIRIIRVLILCVHTTEINVSYVTLSDHSIRILVHTRRPQCN